VAPAPANPTRLTEELNRAKSHVALWDMAMETGQPLTRCEDDAIFNDGFEFDADQVIRTLPPEWDLWEQRCVSSGTQQPTPLRGRLPAIERHHIGIPVK
jgi:hypothetical protein